MVIPTRGRPGSLARVLDALAQQRGEVAFEVVAVSDGADADPAASADLVAGRPYPATHLVASRPGAAAARNAGWRAARSPVALFLGDDVVPSRRALAEHAVWHRRHPAPEVAVLGRVRWPRGLRGRAFRAWLDRGVQFDFGALRPGQDAGWGAFYTANVSVKRDLLARAGGFDEERFPFLYEDLDLAYRMRPLGLRLLYHPAAVAVHHHRVSVDEYARRMALVAPAERSFARAHPEVPPYFHRRLSTAAAAPQARGRGARLAGVVPPGVPWLGPRVWASAEAYFGQRLAPAFLAAWDAADVGSRVHG